MPGSFVSRSSDGKEHCKQHSTCTGPVVIRGTSWHDTVCGDPSKYIVSDTSIPIESAELLDVLRLHTLSWLPALDWHQASHMCKNVGKLKLVTDQLAQIRKCESNLESNLRFQSLENPLEVLYYQLNAMGCLAKAKELYTVVVKPFVKNNESLPYQFLFKTTKTVLEPGKSAVITAHFVIPKGARHNPVTSVTWWTGNGMEMLKANETAVVRAVPGVSLSKTWPRRRSLGLFLWGYDISLTMDNILCIYGEDLLVAVTLGVERIGARASNHRVECIWKPQLSPRCNCSEALLHYANPEGLCSPSCMDAKSKHVHFGLDGNDNDWALTVHRAPPDTNSETQGRVIHGKVQPKTEKFCLVTSDLFHRTTLKTAAPSAPLDVRRCEVVLLEVRVGNDPGRTATESSGLLAIPVRDLRDASEHVYVPASARSTLDVMLRQAWGKRQGLKIHFSDRTRAPRQEEIAAVFDWFALRQRSETRHVVVIDTALDFATSATFSALARMYGSQFEIIPGLSSNELSAALRATQSEPLIAHYTCGAPDCAALTSVADANGKMLFTRSATDALPSCSSTRASYTNTHCVVCQEAEEVILICPRVVVVGTCTGDYGMLLFHKFSHVAASWPAIDRERVRAAEKFKDLGSLVAAHGAFLNLDDISLFAAHCADCHKVSIGRWTSGTYAEHDRHTLRFDVERYMYKTGVIVFEHLCMLSNNRAGIIVTIPSSKYIKENCTSLTMANRHAAAAAVAPSEKAHHHAYSTKDLTAIIVDMATWGVSRYSLGYLDYTYGESQTVSVFSQLTNAVVAATRAHRTLHYRYTRSSPCGGGGYAAVNNVYKLEGGMFFQFTPPSSPTLKSFVRVPGYPNLRLGMSSDMNVGAPASGLEPTERSMAHKVKFVPYAAEIVTLKNGERVFVDQERELICMHVPPASYSQTVRVKCRGVQRDLTETLEHGYCYRNVENRNYRAAVSVRLAVHGNFTEDAVNTFRALNEALDGERMLEDSELPWIADTDTAEAESSYGASSADAKRILDMLQSKNTASDLFECITGADTCLRLANYANNSWPQGGTGTPIAVFAEAEDSGDVIVVRMIMRVSHGARRANMPCSYEPLRFGSLASLVLPKYYTSTADPVKEAQRYITGVGLFVEKILSSLSLLYCNSAALPPEPKGYEEEPSFSKKTPAAGRCLDATTYLSLELVKTKDIFDRLGSLLSQEAERDSDVRQRVRDNAERSSALAGCAVLLAILIDIGVFSVLWFQCYRCRWYGEYHRLEQ